MVIIEISGKHDGFFRAIVKSLKNALRLFNDQIKIIERPFEEEEEFGL